MWWQEIIVFVTKVAVIVAAIEILMWRFFGEPKADSEKE